jgi:predicted site-specific integrase-resolvase
MNAATGTSKPKDRLIYADEVGSRYGIHPKTALRFAKEGKIPAPLKKTFGKRPCWRESVIDRHLESLE